VTLGPLVVNGCLPDADTLRDDPRAAAEAAGEDLKRKLAHALSEAATFTVRRRELQDEQLLRLSDELPLRQLRVPEVPGEAIGPPELEVISKALRLGIEALPRQAIPADDRPREPAGNPDQVRRL
jgi:hypothetical protein